MLKCLMKYEWVKLRRDTLPVGKGIMGAWAKLAARAAFRKGHASYCGHKNAVSPGMWSGGIVGLKSILGTRSRTQALEIMDKLKPSLDMTVRIANALNATTDQLLAHEFSRPEKIYLKEIAERIEKYPVSKRILACEGFNTYLDSLEKFSKT